IIAGGPVKVTDKVFCAECADKIRQKRVQGSGAVAKATPGTGAVRKAPVRAGTVKRSAPGKKQRPGTARRTKTGMRKRPAGAAQKKRMFDEDEEEEYWDEPEKSSLPLILGIGGGGLGLLIIIILVVVMSGGPPEENAFDDDADRNRPTVQVQPQQNKYQREDDAAAEWRRLQDEIEKLQAQGRYGEALQKLNAFMKKWGGTPAAREAASMRGDLEKIKADFEVFQPYQRRAQKALADDDSIGAMNAYSEFGRENPANYFISKAAEGYRKAGQRLPKKTGLTIPVFSGFDGSFLGLSGWFIDQGEIKGEGPGTVWSELPHSNKWFDFTVKMEIMVDSGNPQFMVRGVSRHQDGQLIGFEGAWKNMAEDILPHGSYVNFELKIEGEQWTISVDGTEKDTAVLPSEHSHSGTVAFRFEGDGSLRIRKIEITIDKFD
ncbi:MAG: hypothetical protein ACYS8W_21370, partial [Planctomycetota bacterium]